MIGYKSAAKRFIAVCLTALAVCAVYSNALSAPVKSKKSEMGGVSGRLVNEDGKPQPGATVRLLSKGASIRSSVRPDGAFTFKDITPGFYALDVQTPWRDTGRAFRLEPESSLAAVVRVAAGRSIDCGRIHLIRKGLEIRGSIADKAGNPLTDATVFLARRDGYHRGPAVVEKTGEFRMLVPEWDHSWGPAMLKVLVDGRKLFCEELTGIRAWSTRRVDLRLETEAVTLIGSVANSGVLATKGEVYLYREGQQFDLTAYPVANIGRDGSFRFRDLPRGRYTLYGVLPDRPAFSTEVDLTNSESEARCALNAPSADSGRIDGTLAVTIAGRKFSGVHRILLQKELRRALYLSRSAGEAPRPYVPAAFLENDGDAWTFRAAGLSPGSYSPVFQIVAEDHAARDLEPLKTAVPHLPQSWGLGGSGFYLVHEPWRPIPLDPIAQVLCHGVLATVKLGTTQSVRIVKNYTIEDVRRLTGYQTILSTIQ